jgi:leucyl aminopeptidase
MDVNVAAGRLSDQAVDAVVVYAFESATLSGAAQAVDEALSGALGELIEAGDFVGKAGQVAVLYPRGALATKRVIMVGLGERGQFSVDSIRRAAAQGLQKARELKARNVATTPLSTDMISLRQASEALAEGALLGLYQYQGQKTSDVPEALPETLTLVVDLGETRDTEQGALAGVAVAEGVRLARDCVNLPPNICTPAYLADVAREVGRAVGLKVEVLERKQMESLGMGALLGVAQGSETPPRFIILEHNADKAA